MRLSRPVKLLATVLAAGLAPGAVQGEDLNQAWAIALNVNQQLQSQKAQSAASSYNLAAARSARYPTVRNYTLENFLTVSPEIKVPANGVGGGAAGGAAGAAGAGATGGAGAVAALAVGTGAGALTGVAGTAGAATGGTVTAPILGRGQRELPVSLTSASVPLYTGGRINRSIDQANAQVGVQRNTEFRTALDLKLTVAQAYVGVLRAQKNLEVTRSNVQQLSSSLRDTSNRRAQGLAIRSDELAVQVTLANARLSEIQARTALESAWATYNRYLCRPATSVVPLDELSDLAPGADLAQLAEAATRAFDAPITDDGEIRALVVQAFASRPELAGLVEQAKAYAAQADVARAGIKPQASFNMNFLYLGANQYVYQGIGTATFLIDWTITDSGASRRRAAALRQQEGAALRSRNDLAADVALQVRTNWLTLRQARLALPVTRLAIAQAAENIKVVGDRYRQQLALYTEVLDAETRRIQSLNNFYNALYNESLAVFQLRRSVGDL